MPVTDVPQTVLALDVGGTKLAAGVVRSDGSVLSRLAEPARTEDGPQGMIRRHLALGRLAIAHAGVREDGIDAVGIACGGPLDPFRGIVQAPLHLPGWIDVPLVDIVERAMGVPAAVDNDATAGAIAEWRFGAGRDRGVRDLVYLTISTGIGGGVIADGRVIRGANGNAAELGHLTIDWQGDPCPCGRRGCLETYASGTNIARRAREALAASDEESSLRAIGPAALTARDVAEAAAAGDPLGSRVWDETTGMLGSAVANILDTFNPELVVLGGGVTNAGSQLLDPVRAKGLAQAMGPAREAADVVLATLGEDLGVVAAASVAFDRFLWAREAAPGDGTLAHA
ncbi:MAG TPA: ROK family protein [Candidatus Limnocylindrales bacterium]|nr:ROK family protein [Candidatus Limnocylindrales bacterium]